MIKKVINAKYTYTTLNGAEFLVGQIKDNLHAVKSKRESGFLVSELDKWVAFSTKDNSMVPMYHDTLREALISVENKEDRGIKERIALLSEKSKDMEFLTEFANYSMDSMRRATERVDKILNEK